MTSSTRRRFEGLMSLSPGRTGLVLGACVLFGNSASLAQGLVVLSPEIHTYNSPFVFEYSLNEMILSGKPSKTSATANHVCRGVSIEQMELRVVRIEPDKFLSVMGSLTVNNNSGKDKYATIVFDVLADDSDKVLTSATFKKVDVEQGMTAAKAFRIPLPADLMPVDFRFFGPDKEEFRHRMRLRVTMSLLDE